MAAVTSRELPDETIRAILNVAVRHKKRIKMADEPAAFGRRFRGIELNIKRDPRPAEPADFS